jgi:hypothetical protein
MGKNLPLFEQVFAFRHSLFSSAKRKEKCFIFSPYTIMHYGRFVP